MSDSLFHQGSKFKYREAITYAEHAVVSKQILKKSSGNISLFAFDKGEGLSEHKTPYDAVATIIDGKAEIIIDGEVHAMDSGDTIIMPANVPHALKAIERFKMVLTMIKSN